MVTLNATAAPAATIVAAAGATLSASVSAGQTANFNLQATPGAGFSGTLGFTCSGMPMGTNCSAPSVTVTNGATVSFTVSVTTSGNAPAVSGEPQSFPGMPRMVPLATTLLLLLALLLGLKKREHGEISASTLHWKSVAALACLAFLVNGCGGGASSMQQPPPITTPTGTYTLMATPSATPSGSSKSFLLPAIPLTMVVK